MLEIQGRTHRLCDGSTRRSFLKVGALGIGGLTLPNLLRHQAARGAEATKKKSVILLWMAGGPSHIDTYDMKPQQPDQIRGPFAPVETVVPGMPVCELLPKHVPLADRYSLIKSITHSYGVHDDAQHLVQTGYSLLNARQRGQTHPAQGSVVSKLFGANQPGVPPYVCIPEDFQRHAGFYQHAAFLGKQYDAVNSGSDTGLHPSRTPDFALPAGMTLDRVASRRSLLQVVDGLARQADARAEYEVVDQMQAKAFDLVAGARAREAFELSRESPETRARYGDDKYGQGVLLSRRLIEAGVTFATVNLYDKDIDWWDDHYVIEKNLRARLPRYDQALSALLEDLTLRGLLDDTLVIACGEFGRAPRVDQYAGRGHWPRAMSVLLAGGGIKGGRVVGSTTPDGGEPADRPLHPGDLLCTIYELLGIDPHTFLTDRQNRPVRVVEEGEPIAELL